MNELIVLLIIALGLVSISVITYYHVRSHIRPYFGRVTSILYSGLFSSVLFAYAYFAFTFVTGIVTGDMAGAAFVFVGILITVVCGLILQVYCMVITESKYRRLAYPIFYSGSVFGFFPFLWVLLTIHLSLIFTDVWDREKAKID